MKVNKQSTFTNRKSNIVLNCDHKSNKLKRVIGMNVGSMPMSRFHARFRGNKYIFFLFLFPCIYSDYE